MDAEIREMYRDMSRKQRKLAGSNAGRSAAKAGAERKAPEFYVEFSDYTQAWLAAFDRQAAKQGCKGLETALSRGL